MILLEKALKYAEDCVEGREITTLEVKKQCEIFLNDYKVNQYKDEFKFYFDEKKLKKVNNLLKLFNMATGFNENESALSAIWGFQALLLVNIFGCCNRIKTRKLLFSGGSRNQSPFFFFLPSCSYLSQTETNSLPLLLW